MASGVVRARPPLASDAALDGAEQAGPPAAAASMA